MNDTAHDPSDDVVERVLRNADQTAGISRFGAGEATSIQRDGQTFDTDGTDGEQYDREARAALRRVGGLSTELEDVTEVEYRQLRLERVVLIGVWTAGLPRRRRELACASSPRSPRPRAPVVLDGVLQRRPAARPGHLHRSRQGRRAARHRPATGADTVVCDGELAPASCAHLEDAVKVKVIDRTAADPRHLRPARQEPRGQGPGRAGPAGVPAAAPARLGRVAVPPGRWPGRRRGGGIGTRGPVRRRSRLDRRRIRSAWRSCAARSREMKRAREHQAPGPPSPPRALASRSPATPTPASRACSTASPARACSSRTRCSRPSTPPTRRTTTPDGRVYTLDRHGRLRPAPAAPARRGVPLDARGGRPTPT